MSRGVKALLWAWLAILGSGAGLAAGVGYGQLWAMWQPDGWERTRASETHHDPLTLGELPVGPRSWSLEGYETFQGTGLAQTLQVQGRLPKHGEVSLSLGSGVDLLVKQGELVQGEGCSGELLVGDDFDILLERRDHGFVASQAGQELVCQGRVGEGPFIRAGLGRIQVQNIVLDGTPASPPIAPWLIPVSVLAGALIMLMTAWLEQKVSSLLMVTLTATPLALCLLLAGWDASGVYEALRVPTRTGVRAIPLLLGLVPTGLLKSAHHARSHGRGPRGVWLLLLFSALAASIPFAEPWARVYAGASGAGVGALIWLTVNRPRAYNPLSLLCCALILFAAEYSVRWTEASTLWDANSAMGAGTEETLSTEFDALASGSFPEEGTPVFFPVQPGPKTGATRIACFGGSSTGGAPQTRSLEELYPFMMDQQLADAEVINLGAAGWTSFHIALFAEGFLGPLEVDVATVYLAVNDSSWAPRSYRRLHTAWEHGDLAQGPSVLEKLRLYQGLMLVVRGLRPSSELAVSPTEMEANLRTLASQVPRVLLASEGAQPSPSAFEGYFDAMRAVADDTPGVEFVDLAQDLAVEGSSMFIDQNHLSPAGHAAVAKGFSTELQGLEWIP